MVQPLCGVDTPPATSSLSPEGTTLCRTPNHFTREFILVFYKSCTRIRLPFKDQLHKKYSLVYPPKPKALGFRSLFFSVEFTGQPFLVVRTRQDFLKLLNNFFLFKIKLKQRKWCRALGPTPLSKRSYLPPFNGW